MSTPTTITVKIADGVNFGKGLKYAKQWGGKFNPSDKTWTIPVANMGGAINAPQLYHLIPVGVKRIENHDANCPANWGGVCECGK